MYAKRGSGSFQRVDFWLTMPDGIKLDCTKLIPNGSPPSGGWKCAIVAHGFGLSKFSEMPEAEDLALEGYYTLVYSMRDRVSPKGSLTLSALLKQTI
ncbi:MAG: hypothetical protein L0Y79_12245 [Chlorobi bacterium]|nr:hypothetical protein [Chlorobiota bacterium]